MTKNNERDRWVLLENGYVHTSGLSSKDAQEMLERYQRIFGDLLEYTIVYQPLTD